MEDMLSGLINTELQICSLALETSVCQLLEARTTHQEEQYCMLVPILNLFIFHLFLLYPILTFF